MPLLITRKRNFKQNYAGIFSLKILPLIWLIPRRGPPHETLTPSLAFGLKRALLYQSKVFSSCYNWFKTCVLYRQYSKYVETHCIMSGQHYATAVKHNGV